MRGILSPNFDTVSEHRRYYETKAQFHQMLEGQKTRVSILERSVGEAKMTYADALRNLERISDEIHRVCTFQLRRFFFLKSSLLICLFFRRESTTVQAILENKTSRSHILWYKQNRVRLQIPVLRDHQIVPITRAMNISGYQIKLRHSLLTPHRLKWDILQFIIFLFIIAMVLFQFR